MIATGAIDDEADTTGDDTTGDDAGADVGAGRSPARASSARSSSMRWLLVGVIALLAAVAGFCGFRWWQAERAADLGREAVDRAREYAITLGTYDHTTFDESLAAVAAISTEEFAARYSQVAGDLRALVEQGEGSSVARAEYAGLESVAGDTATVLVFLDQDVTNVLATDGRTDATRFVVTVKRVDGRWLLDGADAK